ncbi:MAG: type I-E CRISPR-associated protein Cse1/CasA [Thermodesulfobacteriota bacterium]
MKAQFNLIDEPWIPCLDRNGKTTDHSLRDTLFRAHELNEIVHVSPLVVSALHRFLLAVLHRVYGPKNMGAWVELWAKGRWSEEALRDYLEKWRDRFYLFDQERPFFQFANIYKKHKVPADPRFVQSLAQELASGNNKVLFDHTHEHVAVSWTPAEAAKYLLAYQAYAIRGGISHVSGEETVYFRDAPLTRGYTVLALGDNLFETLALNLISESTRKFESPKDDALFWEKTNMQKPHKDGNTPAGYLDYLSWPSRKIKLFLDQNGRVSKCQVQQHYPLSGQTPQDPFKAYRMVKKGSSGECGCSLVNEV